VLTLILFTIATGGNTGPTDDPSRRALPRRRDELAEEAWSRREHRLPGRPEASGTTGNDHRRFGNAGLWSARPGARGRDRPARVGTWNRRFPRFHRWAQRGVWGRRMEPWGDDAALEGRRIDATVVRAHQHAAGAVTQGPTIPRSAARAAGSARRSTAPSPPWATR
jgi:transposase